MPAGEAPSRLLSPTRRGANLRQAKQPPGKVAPHDQCAPPSFPGRQPADLDFPRDLRPRKSRIGADITYGEWPVDRRIEQNNRNRGILSRCEVAGCTRPLNGLWQAAFGLVGVPVTLHSEALLVCSPGEFRRFGAV